MARYPDQRRRAGRFLDPGLLAGAAPDPLLSLTLGWLPVSGRFDLLYEVKNVTGFALIDAWLSDSPWRHEMIVSAARHMVLPVLTLAVAPTTEVIRLMRISTSEVYDTNYVKRPPPAACRDAKFYCAMCCTTPCRR